MAGMLLPTIVDDGQTLLCFFHNFETTSSLDHNFFDFGLKGENNIILDLNAMLCNDSSLRNRNMITTMYSVLLKQTPKMRCACQNIIQTLMIG